MVHPPSGFVNMYGSIYTLILTKKTILIVLKRITIQSDIPSQPMINCFSIWQYHTTQFYYDNKRYKDAVTKEQVCEAADHGKNPPDGAKVEVIIIS